VYIVSYFSVQVGEVGFVNYIRLLMYDLSQRVYVCIVIA
jgi:hypothetical protein